jgi:predicted acylesterase/phospholipase RssA
MAARVRLWLIVLLAPLLTGCFAKVTDLPYKEGPAFEAIKETDSNLLVGLAISGGGSRAATFAAGVLDALARTPVTRAGGRQSVLDMVQYISSVSGGSLATGYYAALKPDGPGPMLTASGLSSGYERFFEDYKKNMQLDFQLPVAWRQFLLFRAFNPTKLAYSLADVWDARFFHGMTFADLHAREKRGDIPRIILNGTSYNSGRRFAFTTLPAVDFDYEFVPLLLEKLAPRPDDEGAMIIRRNLEAAKKQFLPLTFEHIKADHRDLRVSLGVVSSASFPPVVGPVTYSVAARAPYQHVGDGGLFDNLGTESLTTLFLKKIPRGSPKRGLIIVIDAAFPFDVNESVLNGDKKGFEIFKEDPGRIVGIMEERANAYQLMLWDTLRTQKILVPDFANLRIEVLGHTAVNWEKVELPEACAGQFGENPKAEAIKQAVARVPTLFKISPCHGALMLEAARKAVEEHRKRIVGFLERP